MVLTGLLLKHLRTNLSNFPNHLIYVSKQDVLKIKSIKLCYECSEINLTNSSTIDLSKLVNLGMF